MPKNYNQIITSIVCLRFVLMQAAENYGLR